MNEEQRSTQVRTALLKAVAVIVVIGVVIALGTMIVVRVLGLDEGDSPGPVGAASSQPDEPMPTTALPVPGDSEEPSPTESASATPTEEAGTGDIVLKVSPIKPRPNERINLTGTYKGADSLGLKVQRFEDGDWRDFGVDATVRVGTYETYVQTGRTGEMRFRMYDPKTKQSSNVVLVTVG